MARVELKQVTKVYPGNVTAVDRIDLVIPDKEFVVLVGPSGCGKTTTLRMVAGLEEITSGTISIDDRVVNDVAPKDRDIAMVFQNYALYPHMSVYKNMAFGLKLRHVPKADIDRRVRDAARILDLEGLLERKPKALSGGQRQRVAVGRAIVREPKAFLFDEPLSNLDARLRVTTRAELKRLHQRLTTTTIYVTHDQEEAMTLGDRIVVMKGGIIHQADTPLGVYGKPANRFVAGFIGMPPMNFFRGRLESDGDGLAFVELEPNREGLASTGKQGDGPTGNAFRVKVAPAAAAKLAGFAGKEVIMGVRPEHFHLSPAGSVHREQMDVAMNVVEPLGNDMDVYMATGLHNHVIGRLEASADLKPGTRVTLHVDMAKAHFFDLEGDGRNLCL